MNFIDYDKLKNVPEGFQWDRDLKILYNLLENSNENIFLTGNAGSGKCYAENEEILMFDGSFKKVQDIKTKDLLMGPDSKPRTVLGTTTGTGELFRIVPVKGEPFVVNGDHVLSLKVSYSMKGYEKGTITNISVREYLKKAKQTQKNENNNFYKVHKLFTVPIEFEEKEIPLDPYYLGLWLGDGTSCNTAITTMDSEIVDFLSELAAKNDCKINKKQKPNDKAFTCDLTRIKIKGNPVKNKILEGLRCLNVLNNKHIPKEYLYNSRKIRLALLAGLIDSDGHHSNGYFEIVSKYRHLADEIVYLARSLGFAAYCKTKIATIKSIGYSCEVYRVSISGELNCVPVRLPRKKCQPRKQIKNVRHTGFSIEPIGEGKYYGFELDGDHLHLNKGFFVNHNSSVLKIFLKNTRKNFVVVAPTGVAAVNAGGTTIHSFFKLPPRVLAPEDVQNSPPIKNADKLDIVIVDEISMVRADIFDAIDLTLRKTGRYPTLPFGGAKMVIVGDLYQIPPIVTADDKAAYSYYYKTPFFFSSRAFKEGDFRHVELTKIYRQKDQQFIDILNRIRIGKAEDSDLRVLNETKYKVRGKDDKFVTLTATKKASQEINYSKLLELPGEVFQYNAHTTGIFKKENCPADDILLLKEGAQIMMCRNDSVDGRWVNGTLGKVVYLDQDKIKVELKNLKNGKLEIHTLDTVVWENVRYEWNGKTEKHEPITIGTLEQFPVKLAWSQTVHKCQGSTVEAADIDMGTGAFASGQTYVALSRCTSLNGIRLKRDIKHSDIIVDPKIRNFFLYLENKKLQEQTLE